LISFPFCEVETREDRSVQLLQSKEGSGHRWEKGKKNEEIKGEVVAVVGCHLFNRHPPFFQLLDEFLLRE
jgi:hypothetical protein